MNKTGWLAECRDDACVLRTDGYGAPVRVHAEFYYTDNASQRRALARATKWAELHSDSKGHKVRTARFVHMELRPDDFDMPGWKALLGG